MYALFFGIVLILIYFIPALIAYDRKHKNKESIAVLNFLLGWTVIGWVAALVWAVSK